MQATQYLQNITNELIISDKPEVKDIINGQQKNNWPFLGKNSEERKKCFFYENVQLTNHSCQMENIHPCVQIVEKLASDSNFNDKLYLFLDTWDPSPSFSERPLGREGGVWRGTNGKYTHLFSDCGETGVRQHLPGQTVLVPGHVGAPQPPTHLILQQGLWGTHHTAIRTGHEPCLFQSRLW